MSLGFTSQAQIVVSSNTVSGPSSSTPVTNCYSPFGTQSTFNGWSVPVESRDYAVGWLSGNQTTKWANAYAVCTQGTDTIIKPAIADNLDSTLFYQNF